jgi:hypothetical protein
MRVVTHRGRQNDCKGTPSVDDGEQWKMKVIVDTKFQCRRDNFQHGGR